MNKINIIPKAKSIKSTDLFFTLTEESHIGVSTDKLLNKGRLLSEYISQMTGISLAVSIGENNPILLKLDNSDEGDESYSIEINENQSIIRASHVSGIARAIQSFRQLLPLNNQTPGKIPCCTIIDSPRFKWRGMHLDVCRHFFAKEDILRFIDLLALYRFNRLHLHLTEDQGWRIEIKKYPKLTEIGAFRDSTLIGHANDRPRRYDDVPYGGFYTQEEMKEIIAYASAREITIVPEIDMPGHMQAAIAAYPELGCTNQKVKPLCHWGISQHILNAEESTVNFMKNVLDEIMDLFPGPYIHVGGDEALKYQWEEERMIQDRMYELGLKSEMELQSWFIRQMAEHIQSKGRSVIGWDEILEGGLAEGAIVMSWRGEKGGIEAASQNHQVIMTPEEYVYFDHYQGDKDSEPLAIHGFTPLEKVYDYQVVPKEIDKEKEHLILGSQGQIWTEYMPDFKHLEYMAFPRVCALSEVLWTSSDEKDFEDFQQRLKDHEKILNSLEVNFKRY